MRPARHAWAVVVVVVALAGAQAFLLAAAGVPILSAASVGEGFPGIPLATVVGALVGAAILSRHPRHLVGWLFCLGQLGVAIGLTARAAGNLALAEGRSPTMGRMGEWVGDLLGGVFALMLLAVLLLLAPSGRLPSPRWRPALLLAVGSYGVLVGTLLTLSRRRGSATQVRCPPHQRSNGWSVSRTPASSPRSWPAPWRSSSGCGGPGARSDSRCGGSRWPPWASPRSRWRRSPST